MIERIIDIHARPGVVDTEVISQIIPQLEPFPPGNGWRVIPMLLEVIAATEELETIDGITDKWLKIEHDGVIGWIFGGYTFINRGGLKYYTPEGLILLAFTGI
jgi:hypothetical protein